MINNVNFISVREILARVTAHPMMKDLTLEQAIRYTLDFIAIVGLPKFYCDKEEVVTIKDYKGLLPCDLVSITQVKDNSTDICLRAMTDSFRPKNEILHTEQAFKTQGRIIFTSFKDGEVTIAYKAMPIDDEGLPMLPDNPVFLKALELYIKKNIFTVYFDMGKINQYVLVNAKDECAWAISECEKEFTTPSISELQSITNMWNTIIPRVTEFDRGFNNLGSREYIKM